MTNNHRRIKKYHIDIHKFFLANTYNCFSQRVIMTVINIIQNYYITENIYIMLKLYPHLDLIKQ